jgi:CubicO group peptidase (beta-lactamase class C family)
MRVVAIALASLIGCSSSGSTSGSTASASGSGSGAGSGSGSSTARYAGIPAAVAPVTAPDTTSVLVMRHGKIDYEGYFNGATAETLHNTRSATKTITALAIGAAIDNKIIPAVTAPAFAYLDDVKPAHPTTLLQAITIEDLLTMSSALDCDDNDDKSPGNEENMYPKPVWLKWAVDIGTRADYTRDASGRGPWHYCTAGVFILGQVLQRAAKQPVDQFIIEHIFKPLGIAKWEFAKSPAGEIMTGGGLALTTRDLAKLGWMIRSGGAAVVSTGFIHAMTTVHGHTGFPSGPNYGYLMWNRPYKTPCGTTDGWFMSGNGGNVVLVFADLDAVVVVTRTHYNSKGMHDQTIKLIEENVLPEISCGR